MKTIYRSRRYGRNTVKRKRFEGLAPFLAYVIMACIAMGIGIAGGDALGGMGGKVVKNIDTETLKQTLDKSMPIIDEMYNSGNTGISFANEFSDVIRTLFGFEPGRLVSVISAQSSIFTNYYTDGYEKYLAQTGRKNAADPSGATGGSDKDGKEPDPSVDKSPSIASSIYLYENDIKKITSGKGTTTKGNVSITNETKHAVDTAKLLNAPLNLIFGKTGPKVLIYHTHTTESYLTNLSNLHDSSISNRSSDPRKNVLIVGEELARILRKTYGVDVIHNGTSHNETTDVGAYVRSLATVERIMKSYPSIGLIFDLHRDGMDGTQRLRAIATIKGKAVAQAMFVVGSEAPDWSENLKLAVHMQAALNGRYPGLMKPIYISVNRYNQHVSNGSLIIEVGGDGNTVSECLETAKYLAWGINEVISGK